MELTFSWEYTIMEQFEKWKKFMNKTAHVLPFKGENSDFDNDLGKNLYEKFIFDLMMRSKIHTDLLLTIPITPIKKTHPLLLSIRIFLQISQHSPF